MNFILFSDYSFFILACYTLSITLMFIFYAHAKIGLHRSYKKLSKND